ncbi:MAG: hypothetical protein LC785_10940 [Acidobacteria bacterium]|nr:hypothetical protein [Acidobacteriota bacterium]MCA1642442.1 hypothetical protein [Acidobacteriota bacterium]
MFRKVPAFAIAALLALSVVAQKQYKPYGEWSEKDAQKMLNDSPWGRSQIETDTSEMFFRPDAVTAGGPSTSADRTSRGATNQATSVNYRVRFLSARPIREALARAIEIAQKPPNPQLPAQLKGFVERTFSDHIVVSVTFDTKDPRFANVPRQAFAAAIPATLKVTTTLIRSDGERLFLADYQPPSNDGLGAKFIFPRKGRDGKPFLSSDFSQVRFVSEVAKQVKLDVRFKVSDMMYNGVLEY